jgi:hypothetical protein
LKRSLDAAIDSSTVTILEDVLNPLQELVGVEIEQLDSSTEPIFMKVAPDEEVPELIERELGLPDEANFAAPPEVI